MDKSNFFYIFHGYGGENSLMPLVSYMESRGHHTLTIDSQRFLYNRSELITQLSEIKAQYSIVFISSAHVWFDTHNYSNFYWNDDSIISAIELINFLSPAYSVYYPHDLQCMMHTTEKRWLSLFNLVLLPYKSNDYYDLKHYCKRIEIIGWIKKAHENSDLTFSAPTCCSPVFFPSNIISFYQKFGAEGYADWFMRYIPQTIPLKMPAGDVEVSSILIRNGYSFFDFSSSVYEIAPRYNTIIASGDSSIVFEAALSGIPVITLLDGVFSDEEYLKNISDIEGVYPIHPDELTTFIEKTNKSHHPLIAGPNILKPFDFPSVYNYITKFN